MKNCNRHINYQEIINGKGNCRSSLFSRMIILALCLIAIMGCRSSSRSNVALSQAGLQITEANFSPTESQTPLPAYTLTNTSTPAPKATPSRTPTATPDSKLAVIPAASGPFSEHSITKDNKTASGLYVQDIDGDGDNDIDIVGGDSSEILWWQNTLIEPEFKLALTAADCNAAGLPETACTGVTTNDNWTPVIREVNGIEMVLVPAGCFMMGNEGGFPEEQPVHRICFDEPFWIDRTEVTVAQFAQFLNGQKVPVDSHEKWLDPGNSVYPAANQLKMQDGEWKPYARHDNNPLESVRWVGADEYCAWRSARLPTEAEWEFAARGPDSLLYPWGDKFVRDNVVRWISRTIVPEVGSKPQGASWVGALDMSSSLFEWVSSLYQSYPYFAADGREVSLDIDDTSDRVFRGSAWYHPDGMHDNVSTTARFNGPPEYAAWYFGFRCAQSINPEENADGKMLSTKPMLTTTFSVNDCMATGLPANACTGVFSNDEWTPVIREFNGVEMALIPAGCFTMGSTDEQIEYAIGELLDRRLVYKNEQPAHQQCFAEPFWIDVYEVTNGQYGSFDVRPGDDLPREYISWFDSGAHCEGRGGRLPTEAEWEYAARGPDNLIFPWGNEFDGTLLNFCDINCSGPGPDASVSDGYPLTAPVGSYPGGVSWVGAFDMSGNVWEWTSGLLAEYPYKTDDGREVDDNRDSSSFRTLRGGSYHCPASAARLANRNEHAPVDTTTIFGFRCVLPFNP